MIKIIELCIRKNIILYIFFRKLVKKNIFLKLYRNELKIISKFKKKLNFVDIGCNDGIFLDYLNKYYKKKINKIYAYEPIDFQFKKLKQKFSKDNRIQIYRSLLSNKSTKTKIIIPYYNFLNFFFEISGYASENLKDIKYDLLKYFKKNLVEKRFQYKHQKIRVEMLDHYKIKADFIKIIIATCQYKILVGAKETIKRNKPIIFLNQRSNKVEKFLSKFGYEKFHFDTKQKKIFKIKKFSKKFHIVFFINKKGLKTTNTN